MTLMLLLHRLMTLHLDSISVHPSHDVTLAKPPPSRLFLASVPPLCHLYKCLFTIFVHRDVISRVILHTQIFMQYLSNKNPGHATIANFLIRHCTVYINGYIHLFNLLLFLLICYFKQTQCPSIQ